MEAPAQVIEGIGGMLPAVAVTALTAGAGAPAFASQTASLKNNHRRCGRQGNRKCF